MKIYIGSSLKDRMICNSSFTTSSDYKIDLSCQECCSMKMTTQQLHYHSSSCMLFHSFSRHDASTSTESTLFETSCMLAKPNFLLPSSAVSHLNRYKWWDMSESMNSVSKRSIWIQRSSWGDDWQWIIQWASSMQQKCFVWCSKKNSTDMLDTAGLE